MLRAVVFDYGNTLIGMDPSTPSTRTDYADVVALPGATRLAAHLAERGVLAAEADRPAFIERFLEVREANRAAAERDGDEITAEASLAQTLAAVGAAPGGDSVETLRRAIAVYFSAEEERIVALPGAIETLRSLRGAGLSVGLLSNATDGRYVERVAQRLGMRSYFDPFVVSADIGVRKPRPEAFRAVLDRWRFAPEEVAMVGDSLYHDVGGANRIGLRSVHFTSIANPFDPPHAGTIVPWAVASSHEALRAVLLPR